ncbi:MAG: PIG-L family deacetylase, partial [Ferruginibacter sp.]
IKSTTQPGNDPLSKQYDFWCSRKNEDIDKLIELAGGLFMEATAASQQNVIGDSIKLNLVFNNRSGLGIGGVVVSVFGNDYTLEGIKTNENKVQTVTVAINDTIRASQPYWLDKGLARGNGSFDVSDQSLIGKAEDYKLIANFRVTMGNEAYDFVKPILFKYTDPVKGELYQPVQLVNPVFVTSRQHLIIFKNDDKGQKRELGFTVQFNRNIADSSKFMYDYNGNSSVVFDSMLHVSRAEIKNIKIIVNSDSLKKDSREYLGGRFSSKGLKGDQVSSLTRIKYDHIPDIYYNYHDRITVLKMDLKTTGKVVGYISGAGDKVPQALEQMGYKVILLKQADIIPGNLNQFDAIITGVRAYNVNEWMNNVYGTLMDYVKEGGTLFTQYNTSSQFGPMKSRIAPYPFTISRGRITDEESSIKFLLPNHPALNYPNKITEKDFEGWVQERSIYNAETIDSNYQRILSMKDADEDEQEGSLIIANYGKGKFVYSGLVFFRELPAGVPGAYRLFANLIAPNDPGKPGNEKKGDKAAGLKQRARRTGGR